MGRRNGGFTMIELAIVLLIIAIIATLSYVAYSRAVKTGRESGERMFLNHMKVAVESFRQDHGFLPPLVNDNIDPVGEFRLDGPLDRITQQPLVRDAAFLRGDTFPTAPRWSVFSLSFYIAGTLAQAQDGVEGPGFTAPLDDGSFSRKGRVYDAYFDIGRDPTRIRQNPTAPQGRPETVIVDRWGKVAARGTWLPLNTIRYYRWEPKFFAPNTPNAGQVQNYNVPKGIALPSLDEEFRNAGFAILSKGPDGQIDNDNARSVVNTDNLVEVAK